MAVENLAQKRCEREAYVPLHPTESHQLLDNLSTAVLLFDADLRLRSLNTAAEDLMSFSARQALGLQLGQFFGGRALRQAVQRAMEMGHRVTERNMELVGNGARTLRVDCTVSPVLEGTAAPEAMVELTAVERQQRLEREDSLAAQQEVVTAMLRGMAHEVKNPLGGIRGAAQLLQRELGEARLREYTQIIIQEADRLRSLVDRMLGPPSLTHREPVNVHEITERVARLLEAEVPPNVEVKRDYDPSLPPVFADLDQVVQAVLNIARNAVDALGASEGTVSLRTRAERMFTMGNVLHRLAVRIDIMDDGPGIPSEIRESIFFPMVTGRAEGTGLGLAIAQNMVHRQNGRIAYHSQPGCTVFSIWLPTEDAR